MRPKLDIILAKFTYVFNQPPIISMNPNLALAVVVYFTLLKNPNSQSKKNLHQNSMHQFSSTAKSSTLSCLLLKNLKLAQVSSTAKMMCPVAMPYIKWDTSKVQHKFNLDFFDNGIITDTVVQHKSKAMCMRFLLASWLMPPKTISCSLERSKTQSCLLFIKTLLQKTSHFSSTYICTQ